ALRSQVATYASGAELQVVSLPSLAWADVHYSINGGPQLNTRMALSDSVLRQPIALHLGDSVSYWITYSTGQFVLDSGISQFHAVPGHRFVVDAAADSTSGVCVADGNSAGHCNLRAALAAAQSAGGSVGIELAVDPSITLGQIMLSAPNSIAN